MPVVLRYKGYALFFYSSEGWPREPMHVHVRGQGGEAKIWCESRASFLLRLGRSILMNNALAARLSFDDQMMWVHLVDGRALGVPLSFFPRLQNATAEQRLQYIFSGNGKGLHWDMLDEDISVEHLLMGHRDPTNVRSRTPGGAVSGVK
jgi:hypothetical protein